MNQKNVACVLLALVCAQLVVSFTQSASVSDDTKGAELTTSQPSGNTGGNTYFGVDANDEEAVRNKQRELSEEKFRQLFGDDVKFEMDNFHHDDDRTQKPAREVLKEALKEVAKSVFQKGKEQIGKIFPSVTSTTTSTSVPLKE